VRTSHGVPRPVRRGALGLALLLSAQGTAGALEPSIARTWNEANLAAIRIDFPAPTVHARNLFHTSVAMWDAWAAYDEQAVGYCHNESAAPGGVSLEAARNEAVSFAAYRVLSHRYALSVNAATTLAELDGLMDSLGYDRTNGSTEGAGAAAVGNRVAASVIGFAASDGSRESTLYDDPFYSPANPPLILAHAGTGLSDPNRWQPLAFDVAQTQNGLRAEKVQVFVGSHWGDVRPFALHLGPGAAIYLNPGMPPQYLGEGDAAYRAGNVEVLKYSSYLDPDDGVTIDISPGTLGNNPLGTNDGNGFTINPWTGAPYEPNVVKRGDYGRVIAEFWADGPSSETPPGHWNALANDVVEHPLFERRFMGEGPEIDPLEWDVRMYFALNAALHDAAVATWWCKAYYDYVRPISSIRHLAQVGQSTDPSGLAYHPGGFPLVPGRIEEIDFSTTSPGARHEHLAGQEGKIAVRAWAGEPADPETQTSGVEWILAENWLPYQRDTFVTPAFAGYTSGHSGFSRAAAEILTRLTGSAFFPGGLMGYTYPAGSLEFEYGPSADLTLQWATYYDAADQAGISRLYGGIHVPADDGPGRRIGAACGIDAWELAIRYFDGSIVEEPFHVTIGPGPPGSFELTWTAERGLYYTVQKRSGDGPFLDLGPAVQALEDVGSAVVAGGEGRGFFRVLKEGGP